MSEAIEGHGQSQTHIANERGRTVVTIKCNCGWHSEKRSTESEAAAELEAHLKKVSKRG